MRGKAKWVLIPLAGLVALVVVTILLAPARVVTLLTDDVDELTLRAVAGRLWNGTAEIRYRGHDLGTLAWSLRPGDLLAGEIGVDWMLEHVDYSASGTGALGTATGSVTASGQVQGVAVSRFLAAYHIHIEGDFELHGLDVRIDHAGLPVAAQGNLHWSGGRALYRLSGQFHDASLPAMTGTLSMTDSGPELRCVQADEPVSLMTARLDPEGWAHIDVTKALTVLAGYPWPGSHADDDVVVTVSERLFTPVAAALD